jgi:hypothetical protein
MEEEIGIVEVPVKWVDLYENTGDEGGFLGRRRKVNEYVLTLNNESVGSKRD